MSADANTIPSDFEPVINAAITESKAGHKTTEFWVTVAASVLTLLGTLPVPEHTKGIIVGVVVGIYTLSRGIAKQGIPAVEPVAPGEQVVVTVPPAGLD